MKDIWDEIDSEKEPTAIDGVNYNFKSSSRIPNGGHKIVCIECGAVCKTRPDDTKSFCAYVARANGWRCKKGKSEWHCPKHPKKVSA